MEIERRMTMIKYKYEYRINKKGAECFRTEYFEEARAKLAELREKKPNVKYDMQTRSVRLNKYGVVDSDYMGRPAWSIWQ